MQARFCCCHLRSNFNFPAFAWSERTAEVGERKDEKPMEAGEPKYDVAIALLWLDYASLEQASEQQAQAMTKLWFKMTHIDCKTSIDRVTTQCDVKLQWLQPNPVVSQVHKASAAHSSVGASPLHDRTIMRLTSTVRKSWIVLLSALPSQSHQSKQLLLWRSQASFEQPEQGILLNLSSC